MTYSVGMIEVGVQRQRRWVETREGVSLDEDVNGEED